ncbi:hypothetical protein [Arachidicoccus terrestris]|uniref:hypothetical protein n=1 Tax=Arachidicoccus terrestris TaxID=2875539 RepID=UPI001CC3DCC5|nr:hypothetical protein [Arachidicoccus terrestris]UAY54270.1 hypothetical protein K9M52_12490 [Arachidicoccus terrestris]
MTLNSFSYVVLTIFEKNISDCFDELSEFILNDERDNYKISKGKINFNKIYINEPPPGGAHFSIFLIWEPRNLIGKTAFLSSYSDGRYTLVLNYCEKYKVKAVSVSFTNRKDTSYLAYMFKYFDFSQNEVVERIIYTIKDDAKWVFYEKGKIQPFEDMANYKNRIKTKRFNRNILLSYLGKMNINIEKGSFWQSNDGIAFYFEQICWSL